MIKKTKSKTSKTRRSGKLSKSKLLLLVFALVFVGFGAFIIYNSFAAPGDELQVKDNAKWSTALAKRIEINPAGGGYGYTLDAWGGIHPFRTHQALPKAPSSGPYFPNHDIARDFVVTNWDPNNPQGYVLDGWGGVHSFGGAPQATGGPYWSGWDIARRIVLLSNKTGGYVLDGWGALHPFAIGANAKPPAIGAGPYWKGQDIARDVILRSDNKVGLILDCHGGVTPFSITGVAQPGAVNGYPYNPNTCDYTSFSGDIDWSQPSGTVVGGQGNFGGFGGRTVGPYISPGLGRVVDAVSAVTNVRHFWVLDEKGNIRPYGIPNQPLYTDAEQAYMTGLANQAATTAAQTAASGGTTAPAGCSKALYQIGAGDSVACIKALQAAIGAKVDGVWGPETQSKRDAKYGRASGGAAPTPTNAPVPGVTLCNSTVLSASLTPILSKIWTHNSWYEARLKSNPLNYGPVLFLHNYVYPKWSAAVKTKAQNAYNAYVALYAERDIASTSRFTSMIRVCNAQKQVQNYDAFNNAVNQWIYTLAVYLN